jgi:predicted nucleic acid-binding Zn ribbon protein
MPPPHDDHDPSAPAAEALLRLLESAGLAEAAALCKVHAVWEQIAGATVSRHASPLQVRGAVLTVAVDAPTWAHELQYHKAELIARVKERAGLDLTDIRTRIGEALDDERHS